MANKCMKRCSISLIIRATEKWKSKPQGSIFSHSLERYYQKKINTSVGEDGEKLEPYCTVCEIVKWNSSVQSLSCVRLFATPKWTTARQAPLSSTISQSWLKFTSIESVMLSNHLTCCRPLLLLPSVFSSIRVFSWRCAITYPKAGMGTRDSGVCS